MSNYHRPEEERHTLDEIEEMEQEELRKEKKKFNIFNKKSLDDIEGVSKDEIAIADDPSVPNFFKLIGRKISQLLSVNLLLIAGNFPLFFILLGVSGYLSVHTLQPVYPVFAPLRGAVLFSQTPATAALWSIFSRQAEATVLTTWDYIVFGIGALFLLTYGPVRTGVTYILRNMFRAEPVFLIHDFFYAIKRNLLQSIIMGILDLGIFGLIIYDIVFFNINYGSSIVMSTMFFMSIAFVIIYFMMRPYMWLMLITFDISIPKIIKNAFLFSLLGIKRNLMVLLGTLLTAIIEYFLLIVYIPLGVIVPFVILPSFLIIMGIYGAYPKIKEVMIDPYYDKAVDETGEE